MGVPEVLSLQQVAERTGFGVRSLRDGCRARQLEHVRFGRTRGMTPAQVEKLIADHTVATEREDALALIRARRRRRQELEQRHALARAGGISPDVHQGAS